MSHSATPATLATGIPSGEAPMHLGLDGKVAIVTGASRGIGAAIAEVLAREGVDLFLVARGRPDLETSAAALRAQTRRSVDSAAVDLRAADAAADVVRQAVAAFGRLDILINCAGDTRSKHFFDATDADWMDAFAVKFHGAVRLTRSAWPHLRASHGCVVNIAGNTARSAHADLAINGAVNAALVHLTRSLSISGAATAYASTRSIRAARGPDAWTARSSGSLPTIPSTVPRLRASSWRPPAYHALPSPAKSPGWPRSWRHPARISSRAPSSTSTA